MFFLWNMLQRHIQLGDGVTRIQCLANHVIDDHLVVGFQQDIIQGFLFIGDLINTGISYKILGFCHLALIQYFMVHRNHSLLGRQMVAKRIEGKEPHPISNRCVNKYKSDETRDSTGKCTKKAKTGKKAPVAKSTQLTYPAFYKIQAYIDADKYECKKK